MNRQYDIALIGGDMRQLYMADYLQKNGYKVAAFGLPSVRSQDSFVKVDTMKEVVESSTYLVLPVPMTRDCNCITTMELDKKLPIDEFRDYLQADHCIIGGNITPVVKNFCLENRIAYYDFMENSDIAYRNAVATAEGTIAEAILHSKGNLHMSEGLVLGYGRCAKVLAQKLKAMGMNVTIGARKEKDRTEANVFGYQSMKLNHIEDRITEFEFIFNTIPDLILNRQILSKVSTETTIIDIASAPGGLDYEAVREFDLNAYLCLGIPGKVAPKASAEILAEAVTSIVKERSE